MTSRPTRAQCGALAGLALLLAIDAAADESLRSRVHSAHKHHSYMLVETEQGTWLYLFDTASGPVETIAVPPAPSDQDALAMTRSSDPRTRVVGLVRLAGVDSAAALDIALTLLADPSPAVRDEARNLILDHPRGAATAAALGLVDEDREDE